MVSAMVLLACTSWHVSADGTAFMVADVKTPFDPVFSPAVGPNAVNPAMALKQFINPDYVATTHRLKDIHAGRRVAPMPGNSQPETVTGLLSADISSAEREQGNAPIEARARPAPVPPVSAILPSSVPVEIPATAPESAPDPGANNIDEEKGLLSKFFALFGFENHENNDEPKPPALNPPKADTTVAEYASRDPVSDRPALKNVIPGRQNQRETGFKKADNNILSGDKPRPEPAITEDVVYRHTEDGVPVASLSLVPNEEHDDARSEPEPEFKSASIAKDQQKTGRNPVADLPQATEQETKLASLPEAAISRDPRKPTIADAATAFFEGSTDGVHTRTGKPGEGDHTRKKQQPGPANPALTINLQTGSEDATGEVRITKRVVPAENTLLGRINAGGVETPLVDEIMTKASQEIIKSGDPGFVVDVPVPTSDAPRLREEQLIMGLEGALGKPLPFADDPDEHCVRRRYGQTWICLESLGWPSVIEDAFATNRLSPGRTNAIIRYDQGIATQYRVSFPAESFDRIAAHFQYLLGAPSGHPDVMVPVFARPGKANRVVQWIAAESGNGPPAILEMREIDDVRWSDTPDTEHGVVRLYRRGMNPVFSMVMAGEIRLIGMKHHNSGKPAFTTAP